MNTIETRRVRGDQVKVGDDIVFLSKVHRVLALEPYHGLPADEGNTRTAIGPDGWRMTLFPESWIEVAG